MVPTSEETPNNYGNMGQNGHAGQIPMGHNGHAGQIPIPNPATSKAVSGQRCMLAPPVMLQRISWIIRSYVILFTLIATILMAVASEGGLKSIKNSSLVYFVSANAIAAVYSIASLILNVTGIVNTMNLEIPIFIKDVIVTALLLTSNGAAITISKQLSDTVGGREYSFSTCSILKKFCAEIKTSIVLSMFAVIGYLVLICLTFIHSKKK